MDNVFLSRLINIINQNDIILNILNSALKLKLDNWYLGAGCIAQTIWNEMHGFPLNSHIKDYDLVYFDNSDLSFDAENSVIQRSKLLFHKLNDKIEIKNEARVHLWYEKHFGFSIQPYSSIEDAISSWPTTATAIGIRIEEPNQFIVYYPFGLEDLFSLIIRPNKRQITKEIYVEKVKRWTSFWPKLTVIPWDSNS